MTQNQEDVSTHSMVVGLHRRFDDITSSITALKQESHDTSRQVVRLDGRLTAVEIRAEESGKREEILFTNVRVQLEDTNKAIKKMFELFDAHRTQEEKDRKQLIIWLMSLVVSVLGSSAVILVKG